MSVKNVEVVITNIKNFERKKTNALRSAVEMGMVTVANYAKMSHRYTDRTGNLTKSIQAGRVLITSSEITGEINANMDYASFVEERWSGRYAYLYPALLASKKEFLRLVKRAVQ